MSRIYYVPKASTTHSGKTGRIYSQPARGFRGGTISGYISEVIERYPAYRRILPHKVRRYADDAYRTYKDPGQVLDPHSPIFFRKSNFYKKYVQKKVLQKKNQTHIRSKSYAQTSFSRKRSRYINRYCLFCRKRRCIQYYWYCSDYCKRKSLKQRARKYRRF